MLRRAGTILLLAFMTASDLSAANVDKASLPLGDGHASLEPMSGHVFACRHTFDTESTEIVGGWLHGDTWAPGDKPIISGQLMWPFALFHLEFDRDAIIVTSNGLPIDEPTGEFPMESDDPDRLFDMHPYSIQPQRLKFAIPRAPFPVDRPKCLPSGMIGFTITGVAFYSALDSSGRDAAAHELLDGCGGRPQRDGHYHYYGASPCLPGSGENVLVGWALDGFPILGMRDSTGHLVTNADLDACHGRREYVEVGTMTYGYTYRLTREFPYTVGCFKGDVPASTPYAIRQGLGALPGPVDLRASVAPTMSRSTAKIGEQIYPQ